MNMIKDAMTKKKVRKLLNTKTPEEYIDLSFRIDLPQSEKAFATRMWLEQSQYTMQDISRARNRHPYWKSIKQKNHQERTQKRFAQHDYSEGVPRAWTNEMLAEFSDLTEVKTDREMAEYFQRSIPSIQAIRRRINLAKKILGEMGKKRITKKMIHTLIQSDEKVLRRKLSEL